jgi:hypothetical protein
MSKKNIVIVLVFIRYFVAFGFRVPAFIGYRSVKSGEEHAN